MIIPFKSVGVNERFTFVSQYPELCTSGIKISKRKYIWDSNGAVCTIGDSNFPCDVDNSCTCTEPRPLTFNDLSIGSIFQFGSVWYSAADREHVYRKLDNVHYRRLSDCDECDISLTSGKVCTADYVHSAQ